MIVLKKDSFGNFITRGENSIPLSAYFGACSDVFGENTRLGKSVQQVYRGARLAEPSVIEGVKVLNPTGAWEFLEQASLPANSLVLASVDGSEWRALTLQQQKNVHIQRVPVALPASFNPASAFSPFLPLEDQMRFLEEWPRVGNSQIDAHHVDIKALEDAGLLPVAIPV